MEPSMKYVVFLSVIFSFSSFAQSISEKAAILVPGGKVTSEYYVTEVTSPSNTEMYVMFTKDGNFRRAEGENCTKDVFTLGKSGVSLADAVASAKKAGKVPSGGWELSADTSKGWVYLLEGVNDGKAGRFQIEAKSGKFLGMQD